MTLTISSKQKKNNQIVSTKTCTRIWRLVSRRMDSWRQDTIKSRLMIVGRIWRETRRRIVSSETPLDFRAVSKLWVISCIPKMYDLVSTVTREPRHVLGILDPKDTRKSMPKPLRIGVRFSIRVETSSREEFVSFNFFF